LHRFIVNKYILSILFVLIFPFYGMTANFYLDSNADPGGDGTTDELAWDTIAEAEAGITGNQSDSFLYVKRGSDFTISEQWDIGAYGTAGHPFTIIAYGTGALPKIHGSSTYGIQISSKNYVTISDLEIYDFTERGIFIWVSAGTIVENCEIHDIGTGVEGNRSGIMVSCSSDSIIRHNIIYGCAYMGIWVTTSSDAAVSDNNIIEYNEVYNNQHCQIDIHATGANTTNTIIRYNLAYQTAGYTNSDIGNGIFFRGGQSSDSIRIVGAQVYGNIINNFSMSSGVASGDAIYVYNRSDNVYIYNNTIYGIKAYNVNAEGIAIGTESITGIKIKNNICMDVGTCLNIGDSSVISEIDNNLWYQPDGGTVPYTKVDGTSYHYDDFVAYKSATGWDTNGLWEDPVFTTNGSDFTLQVTSPAIGAGVDLGNSLLYGLDPTSTWTGNVKPLNQDDYGDWEIGAYVYVEAGPSGGPGTIAGGGSGTIAGGGTGTIEGTEP